MSRCVWSSALGSLVLCACSDSSPNAELRPIELATAPAGLSQDRLVARGDTGHQWYFHNQDVALPDSWRTMTAAEREAAGWQRAPGPLGFGESYIETEIAPGSMTTYFATDVRVDHAAIHSLYLRVNFDDGFVFYLDGHEGGYAFMPGDAIDHDTSALEHEADNRYYTYDISAQIPHLEGADGVVTLAFEVHQSSPDSDDLVFDAELLAWVDDLDRQGTTSTGGIATGSPWLFWDRDESPGDDWNQAGIDTSSWSWGEGPLGFGEYNLVTNTRPGPITTYFRRNVEIESLDASTINEVMARILVDDGFVAYLNGVEVARGSMPAGAPTPTTLADYHESSTYELYDWTDATAGLWQEGQNVVAVEVHQWSSTSSDVVFDLGLDIDIDSGDPDVFDPMWGSPATIDASGQQSLDLNLGMDDFGNAIAVWQRQNGVWDVMASRRPVGSSWTQPELLEYDAANDSLDPHFELEGTGMGAVAWSSPGASEYSRIHARAYDGATGFGIDYRIDFSTNENPPGHARDPEVGVSPAGLSAVTFLLDLGEEAQVWYAYHTPDFDWSPAFLISDEGVAASDPEITVTNTRQHAAVWIERDLAASGPNSRVMANLDLDDPDGDPLTNDDGWIGPMNLMSSVDVSASEPHAVIFEPEGDGRDGDVLVVWSEHTDDADTLWSARYEVVEGWQPATAIPLPAGIHATEPRLAATPDGAHTLVVWRGAERPLFPSGPGQTDLYASYAGADGVWQPAVLVASDDTFSAQAPDLVMNDTGQALVAWLQHDGERFNVLTSWFSPSSLWSAPSSPEDTGMSCLMPRAALNASGESGVSWLLLDGGVQANMSF